jgi:hypothetical protein
MYVAMVKEGSRRAVLSAATTIDRMGVVSFGCARFGVVYVVTCEYFSRMARLLPAPAPPKRTGNIPPTPGEKVMTSMLSLRLRFPSRASASLYVFHHHLKTPVSVQSLPESTSTDLRVIMSEPDPQKQKDSLIITAKKWGGELSTSLRLLAHDLHHTLLCYHDSPSVCTQTTIMRPNDC